MVGSCITAEEVVAVIASHPERCLLIAVDSIAPDHGEALVADLTKLPQPPAVLLLLQTLFLWRSAAKLMDQLFAQHL
jgi:hypothetical protein